MEFWVNQLEVILSCHNANVNTLPNPKWYAFFLKLEFDFCLFGFCSFLASQWRYWNICECLTVLIIARSAVWRERSGEYVSRKHGQFCWSTEVQKRYTTTEAFVENCKETGESAFKHFKSPCASLVSLDKFLAGLFLLK